MDNGETVEVEKIGKGRYTTAWRNGHHVYLQVNRKDSSKEILDQINRQGKITHVPECERLTWETDETDCYWYRMPLYTPLTAKSGDAWIDYRILRSIRDQSFDGNLSAYDNNQRMNIRLMESMSLSDAIKNAIETITDRAADYGEYLIEITKKNCAVGMNGELILLDPLFDRDEVKNARGRQLKRAGF